MVPVSRLSPPHRIYGTRHEICGRERMHTERAQFWGQPHAPPQAKQVHDLAPSLWVTQNHTALSLSCPLHSPPIPLPMNSALIWLPCPNISLPNSFISTQSGWHFKKKGTVPSKLQNFYIKTTITIEQKAGDLEDSVDSLGAHELRNFPSSLDPELPLPPSLIYLLPHSWFKFPPWMAQGAGGLCFSTKAEHYGKFKKLTQQTKCFTQSNFRLTLLLFLLFISCQLPSSGH